MGETRVQLPEGGMETGPLCILVGQLVPLRSITEATHYLETIEITLEQKEEVDNALSRIDEALWRVVEQLDGGAGRRSPAPVVRS